MFMRSVRPAARLAASLAVGYQCVSISSCEDAREMRLRRQATNDDSIGGSFGTRKGHATTHTKGGGFGGSSADADFYEPVHKKVHVLLVELTFASVADREKWTACWSPLTQRVYQNEQNCLSYEMCVANDDPCSVIIYERYVNKSDLDGVHQESLKAHGKLPGSSSGVTPVAKKLTHFTETNIGHMERT